MGSASPFMVLRLEGWKPVPGWYLGELGCWSHSFPVLTGLCLGVGAPGEMVSPLLLLVPLGLVRWRAPQLISGSLTKGMDLWDALESVCPQGKESTEVLVLFSEVSPLKLFSPYPSLHLTNPPTPEWLLFLPHLETPLPFAELLERSLVFILLTSQQPWSCEPTPPSNIFFLGFLLIPHLWVSCWLKNSQS